MKNMFIAVLTFVLVASCNGKKDYSDEEYKKKQIEYEKKKADIYRSSGEFYLKNKQKLMDLVETLKILKDTTKLSIKISKDTNYFKNDVVMKSVNFDVESYQNSNNNRKNDLPNANVFFLHRMHHAPSSETFSNPFKELEACAESKNDVSCIKMKEEALRKVLNLKYAFVVDDLIKADPVMKGEDQFESGLYIGRIICYEILTKKPIYSFVVFAQNNKSISSIKGALEGAIKRDFNSNIRIAIEETCKKHFLFDKI